MGDSHHTTVSSATYLAACTTVALSLSLLLIAEGTSGLSHPLPPLQSHGMAKMAHEKPQMARTDELTRATFESVCKLCRGDI